MAFQLDIVTPDARIFSGEVSAAKFPGSNGSFTVLTLHAPLISSLENGILEVTDTNGKKRAYRTQGGVVEILNNKVNALVETAVAQESEA